LGFGITSIPILFSRCIHYLLSLPLYSCSPDHNRLYVIRQSAFTTADVDNNDHVNTLTLTVSIWV